VSYKDTGFGNYRYIDDEQVGKRTFNTVLIRRLVFLLRPCEGQAAIAVALGDGRLASRRAIRAQDIAATAVDDPFRADAATEGAETISARRFSQNVATAIARLPKGQP